MIAWRARGGRRKEEPIEFCSGKYGNRGAGLPSVGSLGPESSPDIEIGVPPSAGVLCEGGGLGVTAAAGVLARLLLFCCGAFLEEGVIACSGVAV